MSRAGTKSNQGDDFQRVVAMHWLVRLISDGSIESVQAESNGISGFSERITVDDIVVIYKDQSRRYIQVKKNQKENRAWSIADIGDELIKVKEQLMADMSGKVDFYSATPFGSFKSLADACKEYPDLEAFEREAGIKSKDSLNKVAKRWGDSHQKSFELMQRVGFGSSHSLDEWERLNQQELSQLVTNSDVAVAVLDKLLNEHQSKLSNSMFELSFNDVISVLEKSGVIKSTNYAEKYLIDKLAEISRIGRDWNRVIADKQVVRPELEDVVKGIHRRKKTILIHDRPGSGKTCLLLDLVERLENDNYRASLFLKGDRFMSEETRSLLPTDLFEMIARLAEKRQVIVIIDSLDVLSLNRDADSLGYFLNLLDRLTSLSNVTLVVACRTFDLNYDAKLRDRKWGIKIELKDFNFDEIVRPILESWGINIESLNNDLMSLLCLPQNLRLFESIAGSEAGLAVRNAYELQCAFIDESVSKNPDLGNEGLSSLKKLANQLLKGRQHQLSLQQFPDEHIRRKLISQNVLFEAAGQIGFSHQTLFDTLVVHDAIDSYGDLRSFILAYPPLPFLRPSVQTFIFHLRVYNTSLFSRQITQALSDDGIAYHLKRLIVETIAELDINLEADWALVRRIFQNHPDLFKRMFWKVKGESWFRLLVDEWYPLLKKDDQTWHNAFFRKISVWANTYPSEVVFFWIAALKGDLVSDNAKEHICRGLSDFVKWDTVGTQELLEIIDTHYIQDHVGFLKTLGNYNSATGKGDELLWSFMTRNMEDIEPYQFEMGQKLDCDFQDDDFLYQQMSSSSRLLDLVLSSLDKWAKNEEGDGGVLNSAFIDSCPSFKLAHSYNDLEQLLGVLEKVIYEQAKAETVWWEINKIKLSESNLTLFHYFLIRPLSEFPENNLTEIACLITDEQHFVYRGLHYEVGQLMQTAYAWLPEGVREKNQEIILRVYKQEIMKYCGGGDVPEYLSQRFYNFLLRIPSIYRTIDSQKFVDRFVNKFELFLPEPDIGLRGGTVGYPLTLAQILGLTDEALIAYCLHYEDYHDDFGGHPGDNLKGGKGQVQRRLNEAAAYDPERYLKLLPKFKKSGLSDSYLQNIVGGVKDHIRYRFGNLQPSSGEFKYVKPEPNGDVLAEFLLKMIEKENWLWSDNRQFNLFSIPEACCDVLYQLKHTERLIFALFQLFYADLQKESKSLVWPEDITIEPLKRTQFRAINSDWGHVAAGICKLGNRLLNDGQKIPELLFPLLRHLVRFTEDAALVVIRYIPYMTYQKPEWGFKLFSDIYDGDPPNQTWHLATEHLYYQYHRNFEYVAPYLKKMLQSGDPDALASWASISTMSHLSGHITQDFLFKNLSGINEKNVWIASTRVFVANLATHDQSQLCSHGLCRVLEEGAKFGKVLSAVGNVFDPKKNGSYVNAGFALLYIGKADFVGHGQLYFRHLLSWIADMSRRNPLSALEVMEGLVESLSQDSVGSLYYGEPMIIALNSILREADETDDPFLIKRVIAVQDKLFQLDFSGMDEFFLAAERV